jgi:transposase
MGLGRRKRERQEEFWVAANALPEAPRHVFYDTLNRLLESGRFDDFVEELCESYYAGSVGRPSIPPGVYFRMLLVGYFEGIDSQRGIAWRCSDSLSLRQFLQVPLDASTPDHSSLTRVRDRLPLEVHQQVFAFVLSLAEQHKLLGGKTPQGKTVAIDTTLLEANAAMRSIVRKESGEDWKAYLTRLMKEEGLIEEDDEPTDDELRKFDKGRKQKTVSNREWESESDPDSRIAKMKDGRTHLAYKAAHVVDLDSEFLLDAEVLAADQADSSLLVAGVRAAEASLEAAGVETPEVHEVVADKGFHKNEVLAACAAEEVRTYIPEQQRTGNRCWTDKPEEYAAAYRGNRRRTQGSRGRSLQRLRSERVERSFAHTCETGGARRTWLRGYDKINKRYRLVAAARNLGLMMRKLFGFGTPRSLTRAQMAVYRALSAARGALQPLLTIAIRTLQVHHDVLNRFRLFTNQDHITLTLAV